MITPSLFKPPVPDNRNFPRFDSLRVDADHSHTPRIRLELTMGRFTRQELEAAFQLYDRTVREAVATRNWDLWASLFTEDAVYIEHAYGEMRGREAIRDWITRVMAPFPTMHFPQDWVLYDEDNGAIVCCVQNVLPHPTGPTRDFRFPNWTRLVYAGNNQFSMEEDIYNPNKDAPAAIRAWREAGGQFATREQVSMKHKD